MILINIKSIIVMHSHILFVGSKSFFFKTNILNNISTIITTLLNCMITKRGFLFSHILYTKCNIKLEKFLFPLLASYFAHKCHPEYIIIYSIILFPSVDTCRLSIYIKAFKKSQEDINNII
jgi:hypothetical protein